MLIKFWHLFVWGGSWYFVWGGSWGSCGLMDRALDLKPEVTQGFESRLRQNPQLLPGRRNVGCPLLRLFVHLDGLNAENTFHSPL